MRSDQSQKQSTVQARLGICLAATLFAGISAIGCGSSSSGNKADGSTTGTGGTTISSGSGGTDGGSGTGGAKGDGGVVVINGTIGTACNATGDCGGGLTCMAPGDKTIGGVGGPPHGYCTLACTDNPSATACQNAGGTCVDVSGDSTPVGYCFLNCTPGNSTATKCNGRPDVACATLFDNTGMANGAACLPNCSQDSDCPTGRKCDDSTSICVDTPNPGTAFGAHCTYDPTGMTDACAGHCLGIGGSATTIIASFCTRECVLGGTTNCNWVGAGKPLAGAPHGICLPTDTTSDIGDTGVCFPLCDTAADCADQSDPMLVCDTSAMADIGHGVCQWGAASTDGGVADGAAGQ